MKTTKLLLVGKADGERVVAWPALLYRIVTHGLGAIALFVTGYALWFGLAGPRDTGILSLWAAEFSVGSLEARLLAFIGVVLLLTVVAPLVGSRFVALGRLPEAASLPKPSRTGRLALFGLACLATVTALFYTEEDWRGRHSWEHYKRHLEAQGEKLTVAAFVPPPAPDAENFAMTPFLAPLFEFKPHGDYPYQPRDQQAVERTEKFALRFDAASDARCQPKLEPPGGAALHSWAQRPQLRAWYAAYLQGTNFSLPPEAARAFTNSTVPEAAAAVLAALAEYDPVLDELRAACRRPHARFNIPYEDEYPWGLPLRHLGPIRQACSILELRAEARLALGQTDAAFQDVQLMLDLAGAIRDEPLIMSGLVRTRALCGVCQALAQGLDGRQWSDAQLRALQERLLRTDLCAEARRVLEAERVFTGVVLIDSLRRAPERYNLLTYMCDFSWREPRDQNLLVLAGLAPGGWSYLEQLDCNRVFQDYVLPTIDAAGRRISPAAARRLASLVQTDGVHPDARWLLRHELFRHGATLRDIWRFPQRVAFTQAGLDCAAVACALERYRLAHGELPGSLGALEPQFIERLRPDVINGQPLKYRRIDDRRFVLYSVGWNETDDGGRMGFSPSGRYVREEEGDWVWGNPETAQAALKSGG